MASAGTEPVSGTYHVFINHRGPDVKRTLASLIYHRLTNCHGLRVFLDENELHTGDALSSAILGAIESASVHIAIFSKRYAESRWCLDELCWILRCNRKIIPVFYDVEPTDLRYIDNERGCYRKAFEEHQRKGRVGMEDIQKWKTALNKASEISGLLFKTNESDHGEFLEEIVKDVLKGVKWEPFELPKYLVGLDPVVKEINDEIKKQSELNGTVIMGIAGMAGVGKSTLVTSLYNLKRSAFTRFCFLSDVRKKDLSSLQRKLLRDLLGCDFHVEDTRHGKGIFSSRLRGLQVLIVLDDVDHIEQISNLLVTDVVGSGSLILITSRDQALLRRSSPKTVLYDVKPLQIKHAQELFCRHAFDQPEPDEGFECSVEEVLKFCGGLPLSLRVLGGLFHGRSEEEYWKRQLQKLSRRLPDDIRDTLKVSYEALNSDDKEIFLDLGCFLLGEDKEVAVRVLEGLGYKDVGDSLENLRQKCLLDYQDDLQADDEIKCRTDLIDAWHDPNGNYDYLYLPKREKITMHEHIGQLARHIAREKFGVHSPRQPMRLSCSDDIEELMSRLQGGADSCWIRGIRTPKGEHLPECTNYIKGVGVRLFVVEVPIDLSTPFGMWDMSGDLVWLRLRSFSSIYFPDTVSLRNLRVLELEGHGDLEQFFQRFNMQPPLHLSVLNIDMKDTHDYDVISDSAQQGFTARYFFRFLEWIGTSITRPIKSGASTSSSSLDFSDSAMFSNCSREGLTASYFFRFLEWMGTSIKNPSKIVLRNITFLQSLPIGFGELKSLKHLDLSGCRNLTQLPESFSELMHLQFLVLRDCINLSIPLDILGNISSLEYADFKGCRKLQYLPAGMANQKSLRYLNLLYTNLELPLNVKLPEKLQRLKIGNSRLPSSQKEEKKEETAGMANQKSVRYLNLLYTNLKWLFTNLKWLLNVKLPEKLQRLKIVRRYHERGRYHERRIMRFSTMIPSSQKEEEKEEEEEDASAYFYPAKKPAEGTKLRQSLGDLRTKLRQSQLRQSLGDLRTKLRQSLGDLRQLKELKDLSAEDLSSAEGTKLRQSLGDLRQLKELKELILIGLLGADCILWEEIARPNMKVLVIKNCPIDTLNFKAQETMHVAMDALIDFTLRNTRISEICIPEGVLPSLETLDLSENSLLMQVKYLPSTLVRLNLQGCHQLKKLINLSNLVNLKFLCISGCSQLKTLNVEGLTSLEEIQAEGCTMLKTLINLSNLVHLKFLLINRCHQLEALNVEGLTSLEDIRVDECQKLRSIQGLSQLERLKCLGLSSNTEVMLNDICNFLTSTSHEKLEIAFFTGASTISYYDTDMVLRQSITEKFKVKVADVVFPATPSVFHESSFQFHGKMEDFQTYGGILMCFLTIRCGPDVFRVRFEASNDGTSANEYTIICGHDWRYEQKLHVFMWTEECGLFTDDKGYDTIGIYRDTKPLSKGWIIMVDKNIDVSQICKQIIIALSIA